MQPACSSPASATASPHLSPQPATDGVNPNKRRGTKGNEDKRRARAALYAPQYRELQRAHGQELKFVQGQARTAEYLRKLEAEKRDQADKRTHQSSWALSQQTSQLEETEWLLHKQVKETKNVRGQRDQMYQHARSATKLAARCVQSSLEPDGQERCKVLMKKRKVETIRQSQDLRRVSSTFTRMVYGQGGAMPLNEGGKRRMLSEFTSGD